MLITNTPVCSQCKKCVMSRHFSIMDYIGMTIFAILFFPVTIWIYLNPRYLYCRGCGTHLGECII